VKKIDLGQAITILANLGVIAGIVFLAIEVRQNDASLQQANEMNRAAILTDIMSSFSEFRYEIAGSEEVTDLWYRGRRDQELSPIEADRFEDLCRNYFWLLATMHERFVLLDEESIAASGPATTLRDEMRDSNRLRDCWLRTLEYAPDWGYGSITDAFVEDLGN